MTQTTLRKLKGTATLVSGRPKTKQELKLAAQDGELIYLQSANLIRGWTGRADSLPRNIRFVVYGPKKRWIADIINHEGEVIVT